VAGSNETPDGSEPLETVYVNGSTPPAATTLRTNEEPAVPERPEIGAVKMISGLITRVGCDVAELLRTLFVAVVVTTMYFPSSETVGTKEAEVAPEIFVQFVTSLGSSQTFHW
jgi:hypothetical protein